MRPQVDLQTMPQVAAMLRGTEGEGIIRGRHATVRAETTGVYDVVKVFQ
jgi:hypothetical protein